MAGELQHLSVGTELTQAEWEAVGAHVLNLQAAGDMIYASSTTQLSRLAIGGTNAVLRVSGGVPGWATSLAGLTLTTATLTSPVINTQLTGTAVGTGASQVAAGNHTHSDPSNMMTTDTAQTITGVKTFDDTALLLRNPAGTFSYTIAPAAITAARTLTLPLITGADTLVALALAQTLTNKTLTSPVVNTQLTGTAVGTGASQVAAGDHTHAGSPTEATQAAVEAETAEATFVPPDLVKNSPGVAKGWCRITAVGALEAPDYNVDSVTDTGLGDRSIVWGTDFSTSVYTCVAQLAEDTTASSQITIMFSSFAVGSVRHTIRAAGALNDFTTSVHAMGDQ